MQLGRKVFCRHFAGTALIAMLFAAVSLAAPEKPLQIYFVDVEGGQSTLFVTPEGQSVLIDTGWPGENGRDANRIVAAANLAGIQKLDFVLLTHYHMDHTGGVPQLAAKIPIGAFIDHGPNSEAGDKSSDAIFNAYMKVIADKKIKRITVKPGDQLPISGISATIVSSDGKVLENPLPGAGQSNAACKDSQKLMEDTSDNTHSVGTIIEFGKLRILDLGDLTWDKEMPLMCPNNKLGKVDIFVVSHHGSEPSNSRALVHGITPRVAIMDNGAKKGGAAIAWETVEKTPGLEALWQLHYAEKGGPSHNVAAEYIANLSGPDAGNYLKLTAQKDGSFTVFNSRTQQSKTYPAHN